MIQLRNSLLCLTLLAFGQAAFAEDAPAGATVGPVDVSAGYFLAEECTPEADTKLVNECICKADIRKAQVMGLPNGAMTVVNTQLAQVPEQLASESCSGKPTAKPEAGVAVNEASANYEVVYQTPKILTVLVTYSTFGAGAAHPIVGSEGYTFDLANGKTILPTARLSKDQFAKANAFVKEELNKKYGESLLDETKARTEPYLTDAGCENCTLYYGKDGWNLRFQIYAVAPYVAGEPTIVIPTTIIPEPETLIAKK